MYFKTIATEGSIAKASEKLLVGQPALSAQLKSLEESFGQALFERKNRKLILTEAGKAALKYANQIHSLGAELQGVLRDKSFAIRPHLTFGALDSVPKSLVVQLIEKAKAFAQCHITALDGSGEDLRRQLLSHNLDLAITNHHLAATDGERLYTKSIGRAPIAVFGAPSFKPLRKSFPDSLRGQEFILPTSHSKLRNDVERFFEENRIHTKLFVETQDTAIQKLLAIQGLGLIVEPEFAVKQYLDSKDLIALGSLPGVYEEYFLIAPKRSFENPVSEHLFKNFRAFGDDEKKKKNHSPK